MQEQIKKKYYDNISIGKRTKQRVYFVAQHDKPKMFELYIKNSETKQTVVITKSKRNADELCAYLKTKDIQALAIHGNHRAEQLENAANAFNASELNILITTDMILQALELFNIEQIISYDTPYEYENYFKRLAYVDEVGSSILLVSPQEHNFLEVIELKMKLEIAEEKMEGFVATDAQPEAKKDKKKKPRHRKLKQKEAI